MPSPARRRSIIDVAVAAGVSTATVSRVLSGHRSKDDDIARRVRQAARVLHYTANPAASALRAETATALALVVPNSPSPFAAGFVACFAGLAAERGHQVLLLNASSLAPEGRGRSSAGADSRPVFGQVVDGCVMVAAEPGESDAPVPPALRSAPFPVIRVSASEPASVPSSSNGRVGIDLDSTLQLAVARLVERGSRRIALLAPAAESLRGASYFVGFETALAPVHAITRGDWMSFGPTDTKRGYDDVVRMTAGDRDHRPDGIICVTDAVTDGARLALETRLHETTEETSEDRPRLVTITDRHHEDSDEAGTGPSERLRPDFRDMGDAALRLLAEPGAPEWDAPDGRPGDDLSYSSGPKGGEGKGRTTADSDVPTIAIPMLPEWTRPLEPA